MMWPANNPILCSSRKSIFNAPNPELEGQFHASKISFENKHIQGGPKVMPIRFVTSRK